MEETPPPEAEDYDMAVIMRLIYTLTGSALRATIRRYTRFRMTGSRFRAIPSDPVASNASPVGASLLAMGQPPLGSFSRASSLLQNRASEGAPLGTHSNLSMTSVTLCTGMCKRPKGANYRKPRFSIMRYKLDRMSNLAHSRSGRTPNLAHSRSGRMSNLAHLWQKSAPREARFFWLMHRPWSKCREQLRVPGTACCRGLSSRRSLPESHRNGQSYCGRSGRMFG